jgi:hypothetical protein
MHEKSKDDNGFCSNWNWLHTPLGELIKANTLPAIQREENTKREERAPC